MPALPHEPLSPADFTLFNVDDCLPPSPSLPDAVAYALEHYPNFKFLPSNYDSLLNAASPATAHFACDDFRMYEFKVRRCMKGRSHDWTECPFAHPGEKARRRDPRRIHYSGAPCPDFRKGSCRRGDACEFAHGVFECWLHPARYRTQVCKDGKNCKRRVCFFAHSPEQLRVLPVSMACPPVANHSHMEKADGSPVGSPRGQFASVKCSAENFPSHEVFMSSSVGMLGAHSFNSSSHSFNSSSAMALPPSKTHSAVQGSPVSMHLDVSNGMALRRAMLQNMLAYKGGYGANVNAEEYSGQEGLLEAQMLRLSYPVTPLHDKASACRKLSLLLEKKGYDPAVYSHGFASPTSTLEQHIFSPPPLSPPLSPSTSDEIKDSFTNPANGCQTLYVDNTVTPRNTIQPTYLYDNLSGIEGLGFCLQNLQLTHNSDGGFAPRSPHASGQGRMTDFAQQLRLPSFTRGASNLACVSSKQALWGSPCDFQDSEHSKQARDASAYELDACKIGEENTNMDNSVPDFDWVSELVK